MHFVLKVEHWTPEGISVQLPDCATILIISYHLHTSSCDLHSKGRSHEFSFFQRLTSSLPSSASTTSANAPHRDSRLPSSFKHQSWRSPPVLFVIWDLTLDRAKGKFARVGSKDFHKFCLMLLCLSLRKTPTAPVSEDKSILVRLHNHPFGGRDEVPIGVILLVAVRLVVVGARGGLESDAIFPRYTISSHASKLEVLTTWRVGSSTRSFPLSGSERRQPESAAIKREGVRTTEAWGLVHVNNSIQIIFSFLT